MRPRVALWWFASLLAVLSAPQEVAAQKSTIKGKVRSDQKRPIASAQVVLDGVAQSGRTDDDGEFTLKSITPGTHVLSVRRVGFAPWTDTVTVDGQNEVERHIMLTRMTQLDSVTIAARRNDPAMLEFEEHRRMGFGHFLDRADLAANEGRRMSDILAALPGLRIAPGRANRGFILTSRTRVRIGGGACLTRTNLVPARGDGSTYTPTVEDRAMGITCGCYAQVYLDNTLMNPGTPTEPFDVNSIPSDQIEAIEFYSGPSQTPGKYARLNSPCGVYVMHSRRFLSGK